MISLILVVLNRSVELDQGIKERHFLLVLKFDDLLGGGLAVEITQFYGPSNSGKTHLCHLLAVVALSSQYHLVYIDAKGDFSREKSSLLLRQGD